MLIQENNGSHECSSGMVYYYYFIVGWMRILALV